MLAYLTFLFFVQAAAIPMCLRASEDGALPAFAPPALAGVSSDFLVRPLPGSCVTDFSIDFNHSLFPDRRWPDNSPVPCTKLEDPTFAGILAAEKHRTKPCCAINVGQTAQFLVEAQGCSNATKANKTHCSGGADFELQLRGRGITKGRVEDLNNGTYLATFATPFPGMYFFDVVLLWKQFERLDEAWNRTGTYGDPQPDNLHVADSRGRVVWTVKVLGDRPEHIKMRPCSLKDMTTLEGVWVDQKYFTTSGCSPYAMPPLTSALPDSKSPRHFENRNQDEDIGSNGKLKQDEVGLLLPRTNTFWIRVIGDSINNYQFEYMQPGPDFFKHLLPEGETSLVGVPCLGQAKYPPPHVFHMFATPNLSIVITSEYVWDHFDSAKAYMTNINWTFGVLEATLNCTIRKAEHAKWSSLAQHPRWLELRTRNRPDLTLWTSGAHFAAQYSTVFYADFLRKLQAVNPTLSHRDPLVLMHVTATSIHNCGLNDGGYLFGKTDRNIFRRNQIIRQVLCFSASNCDSLDFFSPSVAGANWFHQVQHPLPWCGMSPLEPSTRIDCVHHHHELKTLDALLMKHAILLAVVKHWSGPSSST
eukprot:gb/GEZN01003447.1/.p1 GENE.gb/GEZN01003447.1/~~gb/GEZN01003447.1/.p1  ORF type:complete len:588 (+),score=24.97 gb/GEZN01003447.1/:89-1852(+)